MLIVFSGLPGVGKTTLATRIAQECGAAYLRIDAIEQAIRDAGIADVSTAGYRAAYALAASNLGLGRTVVGDCVNPAQVTRNAWQSVASHAAKPILELEVMCGDRTEHRRRVETRTADIAGLGLPSWDAVEHLAYEVWEDDHMTIETSHASINESVARIREMMAAMGWRES